VRALLCLLLPVCVACGAPDRQGNADLLGHGLPDSHVAPDNDAGFDLGQPPDLLGADLTGLDLSQPSDLAGGALDPNLSLPNASGMPCSMPGSFSGCPSIQVCRFFTATEGRCESCTSCGNLNALCSSSAECDILFMCYLGHCTNFCTLGTSECGPPQDCIDIGHPTRGVCKP